MADSQVTETPAQIAPQPVAAPPPRWLAWSARRPLPLLALLGLLLWLPGILSLPPLDRDESRFAQSSRQMVETGNWVDIRFGHVPRYKKPVGIYWLQAAAASIANTLDNGRDNQIWAYRLPSLLGAIAASWLTVWVALAVAGPEAAFLAGLLMLGSVLLTAEATIATTDAVLLASSLGMQGVVLRLYRAARDGEAAKPSARLVMWGWAAMGFGILVKGPVVIGVAAATVITLLLWDGFKRRTPQENPLTETDAAEPEPAKADVSKKPGLLTRRPAIFFDPSEAGWLRTTRPLWGVLLVLLLIMPWLIAITIQSQGAFIEQSLGNDFAAKLAGGQESHGAWPGYYLLLSAASFWPTILFVFPGLVQGFANRSDPAIRFLLAWALSWWLVVELLPTKLPHYVLEAYPPLAILAAIFVLDPKPARFLAPARWLAILQFGIGAAVFAAALVLLPPHFGSGDPWAIKTAWPWLAAAGLGVLLAFTALVLAVRTKYPAAALWAFLALLVFVPAFAYVAPRLDQLWVTERLRPLVALASEPGDPAPALAGYEEPSMLFDFGADVVLSDGAGAADAVAHQGGLALVEDSERGPFLARLAELQADAAAKGEVSGFNYSRGRKVHVTVYRVARVKD